MINDKQNLSKTGSLSSSLTIHIGPETRHQLESIANEFNVSLGHVVRLTIEDKLSKHLSSLRIIDGVKYVNISNAIMELTQINRDIYH